MLIIENVGNSQKMERITCNPTLLLLTFCSACFFLPPANVHAVNSKGADLGAPGKIPGCIRLGSCPIDTSGERRRTWASEAEM